MDAANPIDVFVSYAATDRERVRPFVSRLQHAGLSVWWDTRIAPGAGFDREIQQALDAARCVLVVWSKESIESEWVLTEASEGLEREILVPLCIDDVRPPLAFRRRQTLSLIENPEAGEQLVVNAVRAVLANKPIEFPRGRKQAGRGGFRLGGGGFVIGALFGAALSFYFFLEPGTEAPPSASQGVRVALDLPDWAQDPLAISPSGQRVAYVARPQQSEGILRLREIDNLGTTDLPGTDGASRPFFSPDGDWVGFHSNGLLKVVPIAGGEPIIVASVRRPMGSSWGRDEIVFSDGVSGLKSVALGGGQPRQLTEIDTSRLETAHVRPHHIPGTQVLLFENQRVTPPHNDEVWALDLETGQRQFLLEGTLPTYASSGHVFFIKPPLNMTAGIGQVSLWRVPFDAEVIEVTGPEELVENSIWGYVRAHSDILIYVPGQPLGGELRIQANDGTFRVLDRGIISAPTFSNNGRFVAAAHHDSGGGNEIWVYDVETGGKRRLAEDAVLPLWSPDDESIVFTRRATGLLRKRVDGIEAATTIVSYEEFIAADRWIGNGKNLLYMRVVEGNDEQRSQLLVLESDGSSSPIDLAARFPAVPTLTTDEAWIAFCDWPKQILVSRFPPTGTNRIVSNEGCYPKWREGNSRLYFQEGGGLWSMETDTGSQALLGAKEFHLQLGDALFRLYDVDQKGRIAYSTSYLLDEQAKLVLVTNWSPD